MRRTNSGLAHGTSGSPQSTIEQEYHGIIASENESRLKQDVESQREAPLIDEILIKELEESGIKFSREKMVFITKDKTGQIVWLESGGASAGLEHILHGNGTTPGHAADFAEAFGVSESEVPEYLHRAITNGTVVSDTMKPIGSRVGYSRQYYYEGGYYVVAGIGSNGFIVSAYPKRM